MTRFSKQYWLEQQQQLNMPRQAWINGEYVDASDGATYDTINPATGATLTATTACSTDDVGRAVGAAKATFASGVWADQSPAERKAVLKKLAMLILQQRETFALMESLNVGKPVMDCYNIDIPGAAGCFEWYAEAIDKLYGEVAPTNSANIATITREPVGVVAAIVPWNFPLDIAAWKLAPALISGNSVILKPAEQSPMTALKLAELAKEAGLPDGVLNVVTGYGDVVGKALGLHMDVDCVAFTGSTAVGKLFMSYSAQSNMKQVWPETGGKSPNLIFADCDLEAAVEHAALGIFFNQGEVCSANSRILVEKSIYDVFVEKFVAKAKAMAVGDPLDPTTQVGALVDANHAANVRSHIRTAINQGAELLTGGLGDESSCLVEPTVFGKVSTDLAIAQDEVFGPVAAVMAFENEEEAISIANNSIYGLAASVWTLNINRAYRVSRRLRAGTVSVNAMDAIDYSVPFGGYKQSGFGRDLSLHAIDKFTQLKTTWITLG